MTAAGHILPPGTTPRQCLSYSTVYFKSLFFWSETKHTVISEQAGVSLSVLKKYLFTALWLLLQAMYCEPAPPTLLGKEPFQLPLPQQTALFHISYPLRCFFPTFVSFIPVWNSMALIMDLGEVGFSLASPCLASTTTFSRSSDSGMNFCWRTGRVVCLSAVLVQGLYIYATLYIFTHPFINSSNWTVTPATSHWTHTSFFSNWRKALWLETKAKNQASPFHSHSLVTSSSST